MSRKCLIPIVTLVIVLSCFKNSQGLKKTDIPSLGNQFLSMHVQYHSLNDELSGRIFDNFIMSLDYGKYYFYKKDIREFNKYRDKTDDYIQNGQFSFIDDIFSVYKKRSKETNRIV